MKSPLLAVISLALCAPDLAFAIDPVELPVFLSQNKAAEEGQGTSEIKPKKRRRRRRRRRVRKVRVHDERYAGLIGGLSLLSPTGASSRIHYGINFGYKVAETGIGKFYPGAYFMLFGEASSPTGDGTADLSGWLFGADAAFHQMFDIPLTFGWYIGLARRSKTQSGSATSSGTTTEISNTFGKFMLATGPHIGFDFRIMPVSLGLEFAWFYVAPATLDFDNLPIELTAMGIMQFSASVRFFF